MTKPDRAANDLFGNVRKANSGDKSARLFRRSREVCLVGPICSIIAKSSEPMVLGYSRTALSMDAKDGADTSAFDGRSEML